MKTGKAAMPDGVIGLHAGNSRGDGTYAVCCRQPQPWSWQVCLCHSAACFAAHQTRLIVWHSDVRNTLMLNIST